MKTETIAEFLARGGSVEKSSEKVSLAQLLQKEGVLNQVDADKMAKDLNETLQNSVDQDIKKNKS
jgi:hypothetical protein